MYAPASNSCISTPIDNWTHVYMNLFTRNSPYYHLLKYLLFLLKHPVYRADCRVAGNVSWLLLVILLSSAPFLIFVNLPFSYNYVVSTLVVRPLLLLLPYTQQCKILGCCVGHYGRKSPWVWRRIVWPDDGDTNFLRNLGKCLPKHTTPYPRGHYLYVDINIVGAIGSEGGGPVRRHVLSCVLE